MERLRAAGKEITMSEEAYKFCPDCELELLETDFFIDKVKSTGRCTYCKECTKPRRARLMAEARAKISPEANRAQWRKDSAAWRARQKDG